jgi:integrase
MPGKQAKILSDEIIKDLLTYAGRSRYPARNKVIVLLSVKAGLRAAEIANLKWPFWDTLSSAGPTLILRARPKPISGVAMVLEMNAQEARTRCHPLPQSI